MGVTATTPYLRMLLFFALESTGAVPSTSNMTPIVTTTSTSSSTSLQSARTQVDSANESNETKIKARGMILQQLVELKNLKDANVLTNDEFEEQKKKMLEDLKKL
ncbi:uncharacterized protein LOC116295081 [Actinia tenebrosa]|uniref:Uncharacterized protein LOC116295081 n=1 Tax=Actinia tenebrosa TaxID=6105 RepID=A0A6P8HTA4_ACTTE|nr:uncharacterized protein LOC116295081 [Actinia tenebrosa]